MSYQYIDKTTPKAKKKYSCIWCVDLINIDEIHVKEISKYEGNFQSCRWHLDCYNVSTDYFSDCNYDECEFMPHEHKRGTLEEA